MDNEVPFYTAADCDPLLKEAMYELWRIGNLFKNACEWCDRHWESNPYPDFRERLRPTLDLRDRIENFLKTGINK